MRQMLTKIPPSCWKSLEAIKALNPTINACAHHADYVEFHHLAVFRCHRMNRYALCFWKVQSHPRQEPTKPSLSPFPVRPCIRLFPYSRSNQRYGIWNISLLITLEPPPGCPLGLASPVRKPNRTYRPVQPMLLQVELLFLLNPSSYVF